MSFVKNISNSTLFSTEEIKKLELSVCHLMETKDLLTTISCPNKGIDFQIHLLINFFGNSLVEMTNFKSPNALERNFNKFIEKLNEWYRETKDHHEEQAKNNDKKH